MVKDMQRSKLYAAEDAARAKMPGKELPTVKDVERYIRKQLDRETLRTRYGSAIDLKNWPIEVGDGRGTRRAFAHGTRKITVPLWARNEWVVLHEIAHIIHGRLSVESRITYGTRVQELEGGVSHGWQFAAIFIDLVHFIMGKAYADLLKAEYKAHKVRYRAKRVVASRQGIKPTFGRKPEVTDEHARIAVEGVAA